MCCLVASRHGFSEEGSAYIEASSPTDLILHSDELYDEVKEAHIHLTVVSKIEGYGEYAPAIKY